MPIADVDSMGVPADIKWLLVWSTDRPSDWIDAAATPSPSKDRCKRT
jgi:hypothetical protein